MKRIDALLAAMTDARASDLHLKVGRSPMMRVDGALRSVEDGSLAPEELARILDELLTPEQRQRFDRLHELDLSYQPASVRDRFRVNVFQRMGFPGAVLRRIPRAVPSLDQLGFAPVLKRLVKAEQGLVLVTGPTGSGKSTTLAAMLRELNETEALHVVTIEDPIEFVQDDNRCVINQREVGIDTDSFAEALRRSLRQDPDVIIVGEMRDADTMTIATTAAETGHLVLSTLHTNDAKQSVDRIVNTFPPSEQLQIRLKLAMVLRGIVSQSLIARTDGKGRVCIQEILVNTPYVQDLIKKGDIGRIDDAIDAAPAQDGMQSKNKALFQAWCDGLISEADAVAFSNRPTDLGILLRTRKFESSRAAAAPAAVVAPVPPPAAPGNAAPAVAWRGKGAGRGAS